MSYATRFNHGWEANLLDDWRKYLSLATPRHATISSEKFAISLSRRGSRASNEILEGWDDERSWYRVLFGEGNPHDEVKRSSTVLEYLSSRAVFSFCKSESVGDGEEVYPIPNGH
jgi:hypothetical protein